MFRSVEEENIMVKNKLKLIEFVEYFYKNKEIDFWVVFKEFEKQNHK